jgi:ComF family protein
LNQMNPLNPAAAKSLIRSLDYLLHLFFPDRCLFCRAFLSVTDGVPLCDTCRRTYAPVGRICPRCERFCTGAHSCTCSTASSPLKMLFALSLYDHKWRFMLHDLKYKKRRYLARPIGIWLAREITAYSYCKPQLIVPVPLHSFREKERGFNQSALIAGYVSHILGVPCRQLLVKRMSTVSQTTISRQKRHENVRGVFSCVESLPPGATVLLVDDIYSTGATMKEAASVLEKCGANVYGAVVSYNPRIA